jgi:enediyne biosynthesis protein E4
VAHRLRLRVQWPQGAWSAWQNVAADAFYMVDRQAGVSPWKAP